MYANFCVSTEHAYIDQAYLFPLLHIIVKCSWWSFQYVLLCAGSEDFCLLVYNAMQSIESQPTFQENISPLSSG
jgi:hypothetical protein